MLGVWQFDTEDNEFMQWLFPVQVTASVHNDSWINHSKIAVLSKKAVETFKSDALIQANLLHERRHVYGHVYRHV